MNFIQDWASITIFLLFVAGSHSAKSKQDDTFYDYRLPKTVIPTEYEVLLMPTMGGNFELHGIVTIKATVQRPTNTVTLHYGSVNITHNTVTVNNKLVNITSTRYNSTTEKYEITINQTMDKGAAISINMEYHGKLRDDMIGFYRSSYVDSNGKIKWMASTQFQTAHARHAFPCFDEPSFKAKFIIRILRSKEYACLSNMPLRRSVPTKERFWDEFEQSIPMSTYLVAFTISDFQSLKVGNFSVWARLNAIDQAKFALDIGPRGLQHLSNFFKQPYQLPKMDMVAVPDFSAGAMENWGLITYRETRVLNDPSSTSESAKQTIAAVIVHELTHMWFGNMVTPEWWSYLWLSEAFARYFQYFGTAQIEKSWNMEEQFVVDQHQTAYASDGVESSQPMTREVSNSQHLGSIGDTITYNKGGSIVRMMNLAFGSEVFQAGLQNYLINNKEKKVAQPENLWMEFQKEINNRNQLLNSTVRDIMSTWTAQAGYPVVDVTINSLGVVSLQQKRFFLRNLKSTPTNLTWWVPLTWTTKENPNFNIVTPRYWLNKSQDTIRIGNVSGWVIFNVQSSGFYRVNYDSASWYRIFDTLNSKNYGDIHVLNRAALVDDTLNLARAGMLSYNTSFDCLRYLESETNYLPFKSAFYGLSYLDKRLSGHPEYYEEFKKFVLTLIQNVYKKVGYFDKPSDDGLTMLLRAELNKWACNYGDQGCIQTFTNKFSQWRKDNASTIKPNQRPVAYCMGVKYGSKEDWDFLWDQYFYSNSANEQITIIQALGCTDNRTILEKYLLSALKSFEESRIRRQDCGSVFSAVYGSGMSNAEFVLNFVDKYHGQMKEYDGLSLVSSVLSSASQHFSTQQLVDKFDDLIKRRKVEFDSILSSLQNALEIAKYELLWFEKNKDPIISWIKSYNQDKPLDNTTSETTDYLLPKTLIPSEYHISITTDVDLVNNFTFSGTVKIETVVKNNTKTIVLHSSDLVHNNVDIIVDDKPTKTPNLSTNPKYDFLIIDVGEELQVGQNVTIVVSFKGILNEDMRGFYRSWYNDKIGERWLAATHMEPVGARKMFPCFDEPAMKAKFSITVNVPQHFNVISNMPAEHPMQLENYHKLVVFKKTPVMSTYLVALVIADFSVVNNGSYSVWARPDAIQDTTYALSVMEPLVNYYEKALSIPYQLPKLDMVALPDFVSGAMENWGLLTFKERYLVYEPQSTTELKQSIINIISHEITHQWFGDLVSPLWWKYIWLNEGFARYFQYHGTANVMKDWSLEEQFVVEQLHSALAADSLTSTHPMTYDVYSPTEIKGVFDTINYAKAASVIRMMAKTLGDDVFFKALHTYLEKRKYNVATPEDLFDAFKEHISDRDTSSSFHEIMNTWTTQPGYPVVHVTVESNRTTIRQERFMLKPEKDSFASNIWHIPITWTYLNDSNFNDTRPKQWFKNSSMDLSTSNDLILLNVQQSGFYRTNYDVKTWQRIINQLKDQEYQNIHEINRAALVDDLMNLGRAEVVDYDIVLSAMQYLTNETSYIPWRAFFNGLNYLHKHMQERDVYGAYKQYVSSLIRPIYNKLGFYNKETDSHVTKLFRSHVRAWACKLNVGDCENIAWSLWLPNYSSNNSTPLLGDYRSVVYCTAARKNRMPDWQYLLSLYSIDIAAHKTIVLQSLACATDKVMLEELLHLAITKRSGIRFEDSSSVFSYVMDASAEGVEAVIDFVRKNFTEMLKFYRQESDTLNIVSAIGKKVFTQKLHDKYAKLLDWLSGIDPASRLTFNSYKNDAVYEVKWAERHIPKLHEWFETNYPVENYRLPSTFSPLKYNVFLSPGFEETNFTFTGRVKIEVQRKKDDVSRIVVNAYKLEIKKVSVYDKSSTDEFQVSNWLTNSKTQTLSIFMKNFIKSNNVTVDIEYTGYLNENMEGFYRSHYVNSDGKLRWLATTQFEPTYARQAFPCFDEPALKAKFVIHMKRPKDYVALSNMPLSGTSNDTNRVWDTFEETEIMSTYLIAFVVSDFQPLRNFTQFVNVWGRPEIVEKGELAEIVGLRMLDYLSSETGLKYSLPKLDLVAIPDFDMGAMENWGLVTLREYGVFYDKNVTTANYKDYIVTIIAHELAHMMFGNLVTCDWWEYIWLNEGFAEYMQWRLSDIYLPSYGYSDLFVVEELQPALLNDGSSSTHPMNNPVSKPSDIRKIFDTVTYGKSSSVIRMVQKTFGPDVFLKATHKYLVDHQHSTATPKDLWKSFDEEVRKKGSLGEWNIAFEELMDGWTNVRGYPIVHANLEDGRVTLTQKSSSMYNNSGDFWIPITIRDSKSKDFENTTPDYWLNEESILTLLNPGAEWFIVNIQQSGYYRVNYDNDSWESLITALKKSNHSGIHHTNRAQIVDDLFNLARKGYVSYNITIPAMTFLREEKSYLPWRAFFNGLNFLMQRSEGRNGSESLKKYVSLLTAKMHKQLGIKDSYPEDHLTQLNRELILTWTCKSDTKDRLNATGMFYEWRQTGENRISPNARPAIYCTAMKYGSAIEWNFLWNQYQKEQLATEKKVILNALGCTTDETLLKQYVNRTLDPSYPSKVRKQDISAAFASIYNAGEIGVNLILDLLLNNYQKLYDYYGNSNGIIDLLSKVSSRVSTSHQYVQLLRIAEFTAGKKPSVLPAANSAIGTAKKNLEWYSDNARDIYDALNRVITELEKEDKNGAITLHPLSMLSTTVFSIIVYILIR